MSRRHKLPTITEPMTALQMLSPRHAHALRWSCASCGATGVGRGGTRSDAERAARLRHTGTYRCQSTLAFTEYTAHA